jgi:hypothetical protein
MSWLLIALGINAIAGLLIFESVWKTVKPIREINEERDSLYPAFRR